nr:transposase [Vibrio diabolicus]
MQKYNVIAIDLAKNVFQVCKLSPQGKVIYNREISRTKLKELLIKEKLSLVAMESCSSAHYWARYAKAAGHQIKVINARAVKGFQTKQKQIRTMLLLLPPQHLLSISIAFEFNLWMSKRCNQWNEPEI